MRRRFALRGLAGALHHGEQKRRKARKLDGRAEAHLIALTCSVPPDERKRWSLHLLGRQLVAAEVVDTVSHETVRLHSAIGYLTPRDTLCGRASAIFAARDKRLPLARAQRKTKRLHPQPAV